MPGSVASVQCVVRNSWPSLIIGAPVRRRRLDAEPEVAERDDGDDHQHDVAHDVDDRPG